MKLWGLPVVVVMTIALPVAAKAAHRYGYLTEATNRMLALTPHFQFDVLHPDLPAAFSVFIHRG